MKRKKMALKTKIQRNRRRIKMRNIEIDRENTLVLSNMMFLMHMIEEKNATKNMSTIVKHDIRMRYASKQT